MPARGDITLFKSVGHATQDLVVTELLLDRLGIPFTTGLPLVRAGVTA